MYFDILNAVKFVFNVIMNIVNNVIIYFLAISVIDYIYQWWEYEKKIKMSKQELIGLSKSELESEIAKIGEKSFRAKQICQ